jgi:hypothetical protein
MTSSGAGPTDLLPSLTVGFRFVALSNEPHQAEHVQSGGSVWDAEQAVLI